VHICDIRNDAPLLSKKVSESAITGITLSSSVPGLFVTASENEYVRIWDIQNNEMELIHEKKLKLVKKNKLIYFQNLWIYNRILMITFKGFTKFGTLVA
jgi:hypothetical protein